MVTKLTQQVVTQSIAGLLFFLAIIFISAGTWNYWQGWLFMAVFSVTTTAFTIYLALYDRPLLERRMNAGPWKEKEWSQKVIVSLIILSFFSFIILAVLDHRFGLSPVPAWATLTGNAIILLSFLFIFRVIKVNSWAASNIQVEEGQKVIDTGPYAYVRHPMYAGAIWMLAGIPFALGSWWPVGLLIPSFPVLLWRMLDEERILRRDLAGYTEYMQKVRYRLIPGIF